MQRRGANSLAKAINFVFARNGRNLLTPHPEHGGAALEMLLLFGAISELPCSPQVLTEAALSPVVVGQAVVALGPRGPFPALTVAGLVAAVVHGADLVAVTFCPETQGGHSLSCLGSCACSSLRDGLGALGKSGDVLWKRA